MSQPPGNLKLDLLLNEVHELRRELRAMQTRIGLASPSRSEEPPRPLFSMYFDRVEADRKPYVAVFSGIITAKIKLSPIRMAVFLVYLLDLMDRASGGEGVADLMKLIREALELLDQNSRDDQDLANGIRVAVYRFENFIQSNRSLRTAEHRLAFNSGANRLQVLDAGGEDVSSTLEFRTSTNVGAISLFTDKALSGSPLRRLKEHNALYVPQGPVGVDEFLLELYNHPHRLDVTSLYIRPPFTSYPLALLEFIGATAKTIERKRLSLAGYKEKRFKFREILTRETVWDLIRYSEQRGFKRYPKNVDASQVESHIDHLIYLLGEYENYELFVTDAVPPFVVVTYRIHTEPFPEAYTVFFQPFSSGAGSDLGCFAIADADVYRSVHENVVEFVLSHPTTERSRSEVIKLLEEVRDHLHEKGPLPYLD